MPDDRFAVEKGDGILKDYLFGNKTMTHKVRLKIYLTLYVCFALDQTMLTQETSSAQPVGPQSWAGNTPKGHPSVST